MPQHGTDGTTSSYAVFVLGIGDALGVHFRFAARRGLKCEGSSREGAIITIKTLLLLALIPAFAGAQKAPAPPIPWATVNGSADGYSIKLESASPPPGTPLAVGQNVEFKIRASYRLSIASSGFVAVVVQDETNKNLLGDRKQQTQPVRRGHGDLTLVEHLVVPSGIQEVRLFVPIVPSGISHTSGELMIRFPIAKPTAESLRELLGELNFQAVFADLLDRQKTYLRAEFEHDKAYATLNADQRVILTEFHANALSVIDEVVQWTRYEDMLLTALQNSYTQSDVDALIEFYGSDPGRAVVAQLPLGVQAFTPELNAELEAIYESQGAGAAAAKLKEVMDVSFKPSEIAGVCEFFKSTQGKHIAAQKPKVVSQLQTAVDAVAKEVEIRMRAMEAEFQSRIRAAADTSPSAVTGH